MGYVRDKLIISINCDVYIAKCVLNRSHRVLFSYHVEVVTTFLLLPKLDLNLF